MSSDSLEGVALVTGGGRGIGASIARELADAGMTVAVTGRTPETRSSPSRRRSAGMALVGDVSQRGRRRALGRDRRARARADRAARRATPGSPAAASRSSGAGAGRVVARVRGERARRVPLLPRRVPRAWPSVGAVGSSTSAAAAPTCRSRTRRWRSARRTAPSKAALGRFCGDRSPPQLRTARHPRLPDQPGARADGHDRARSATTLRGRRPSSRRGSCACSPRAVQTRSRAGTSTRSTTTSRS